VTGSLRKQAEAKLRQLPVADINIMHALADYYLQKNEVIWAAGWLDKAEWRLERWIERGVLEEYQISQLREAGEKFRSRIHEQYKAADEERVDD